MTLEPLPREKGKRPGKKEQEIIAGILFLPYAPLGNDVNDDGNKGLLIQVWDQEACWDLSSTVNNQIPLRMCERYRIGEPPRTDAFQHISSQAAQTCCTSILLASFNMSNEF